MYLLELTKNAISSLSVNKARLIFGVISISIGIATLISAISIYETHRMFLKREMEKIGTNLMSFSLENAPFSLTDRDVEMVKGCRGVLRVDSVAVRGYGQVQYFNKNLKGVWLTGRTPQLKEMLKLSLKQGRFFTQQEVESRCNVGVIGKELAYNLFSNRNPIGETIFIVVKEGKVAIRIIGVLEEIGIFQRNMGGVENKGIILPVTYLRQYLLPKRLQDKFAEIMVQADSSSEVKRVINRIKRAFLLYRNHTCQVLTVEDFLKYESDLLKRTTLIGLCIAIVFLIVGGIGIINIMLKSVMERTREIGIRKAVGAKKQDILIQFLIEALMIGILGGIAGILIGLVGVNFIPAGLIMGGTVIVSLQTIFISSGVAIGISLLFGSYPAYRASSLPPIDALRYE